MYVIGGRRLDKNFLSGARPACGHARVAVSESRAIISRRIRCWIPSDPGKRSDAARPAEKFAPLVKAVRQYNQEMTGIVHWSSDQADDEVFHAIPLRGAGKDRPLLACCWWEIRGGRTSN